MDALVAATKILILFAHPALEKSRVNRRLADAVCDLPGVTFHDLYEVYPEFDIDVPREQSLLAAHQLVVFQHPFFWYSTPAILKQWQDLVLQHGWAYGSTGTALRGKTLLSVVTTGGREDAYHRDGFNRFTVRELLAPIEQTAYLCGMDYLPPFVVHGTHRMTAVEIAQHADDYRRVIRALRDGHIKSAAARHYDRINQSLDKIIRDPTVER
jgi:glutathione-regulated potassium-efflux system ancillary protein KefG